jgi:hypothetical protein
MGLTTRVAVGDWGAVAGKGEVEEKGAAGEERVALPGDCTTKQLPVTNRRCNVHNDKNNTTDENNKSTNNNNHTFPLRRPGVPMFIIMM